MLSLSLFPDLEEHSPHRDEADRTFQDRRRWRLWAEAFDLQLLEQLLQLEAQEQRVARPPLLLLPLSRGVAPPFPLPPPRLLLLLRIRRQPPVHGAQGGEHVLDACRSVMVTSDTSVGRGSTAGEG